MLLAKHFLFFKAISQRLRLRIHTYKEQNHLLEPGGWKHRSTITLSGLLC